jgi:hypothetical protein
MLSWLPLRRPSKIWTKNGKKKETINLRIMNDVGCSLVETIEVGMTHLTLPVSDINLNYKILNGLE